MEYLYSEVLAGLSYALDLTEGQRPGHSARSCLIGMRVADEVGLPAELRPALFHALLMKDLGCSSNAARFSKLFGADDHDVKARLKSVDWTHAVESFRFVARSVAPGQFWLKRVWHALAMYARGPSGAREVVLTRCERGAEIATLLGFPAETADAIRALDEHWDGKGQPYQLSGDQIPYLARILNLAQTVEVFLTTHDLHTALDMAHSRRDRWFDPDLVDALLSTRGDDAFWTGIRRNLIENVRKLEPPDRPVVVTDARLDQLAEAFAGVIDAKSPWTYEHSTGVAATAVDLATVMGFNTDQIRDLRRAALLHDLGKLGVSNLILDKPGRLTPREFAILRRHPVETAAIMERVTCLRPLADVASAHHERLDGTGYHRGLDARHLSRAQRVLCVADICDALRGTRPYRPGLPPERVLEILERDAGTAVDIDCVVALRQVIGERPVAGSLLTPAIRVVGALADDHEQAA